MFENIVTSFKTLTASDRSMGQFKMKVSESVGAFRRKIISTAEESPKNICSEETEPDETAQINPLYFDNININNYTKSRSNHTRYDVDPYRLVYGSFLDVESDEESDDDIVDRFVRSVNHEDESLLRPKFILNNSFRRRNDREEIRRRLATGDADEFSTNERPGKKPSLQSRLQSGMNLQICFMNETMSDTESPSSDQDSPAKTASSKTSSKSESTESPPKPLAAKPVRPLFNNKTQPVPQETMQTEPDFFAQQAKLQADARQALAEAKETARRQMEIERQRMTTSPITDMLRASLTKVGVPFPEERRRLSRQLLTNMNVAQLQVIVNDLHTQIEILNEDLVKFLMERDELHMGQDSMLVDIEDLTRYLGAKEKSLKDDLRQNNNLDTVKLLSPMPIKPKQTRTTPLSMIKK